MGRGGGIYLQKEFVLDKIVLSRQEKQEILSSLQNLLIAGEMKTGDTLAKLSALFQMPAATMTGR